MIIIIATVGSEEINIDISHKKIAARAQWGCEQFVFCTLVAAVWLLLAVVVHPSEQPALRRLAKGKNETR